MRTSIFLTNVLLNLVNVLFSRLGNKFEDDAEERTDPGSSVSVLLDISAWLA